MNYRILFNKYLRVEYLALIISLIAIWATYQQNKINREFYELSVKPLLIHSKIYSPNRIGISIQNDGLGVAIMDSVIIKYNGRRISSIDLVHMIEESNKDINYRTFSWGSYNTTTIKSSSERLWLFRLETDDDVLELWKMFDNEGIHSIFSKRHIDLYYRDLYENRNIYSF